MFVTSKTRVIVQGLTGRRATEYARAAIASGTQIVAGVRPGKGGETHLDLPIFNTVSEARTETGADATIIFVPSPKTHGAVVEAVDSGIEVIICPAEGYAVHDMIKVREMLATTDTRPLVIGPNCPGVIVPGECLLGIMPSTVFSPGPVGIVTRAGTLTYEVADQLTRAGLGQSACIGVGADPVTGMSLAKAAELLLTSDSTQALLVIGEIGGGAEEELATRLQTLPSTKPVIAFVAGRSAPAEQRMGHAGAIISGGVGTAASKELALKQAGVTVVSSVSEIASVIAQRLN